MNAKDDSCSFQDVNITSYDELEHEYNKIRSNRGYGEAVFRGQSSTEWGLVPTLFRDSVGIEEVNGEYFEEKLYQEFVDVKKFVKLADRIGIPLPGDLQILLNNRDSLREFVNSTLYLNWYTTYINPYREILTIGQHHGVHTRFLDFSFDAYAALYFAAEGAFKKLNNSEDIDVTLKSSFALWGIHRSYLFNPDCSIGHFEVPTARNKYLNAQSGLFLYSDFPIRGYGTKSINLDLKNVSINNCEEILKKGEGFKSTWPVIFRFIFPYGLAPVVLQQLDRRYNVNLTSIKPNLDNIIPLKQFREDVNNLSYILRHRYT